MCTSFKLKSHIYENKSSQLLVDHLRGVAKIAKETSQLNVYVMTSEKQVHIFKNT